MDVRTNPPEMALLERLLAATGPTTVQALGRSLGWPVGRVSQHLDRLQQAGCRFDRHPQHGLRLLEAGLGCWVDYLESRHAGRLGRKVIVYRSTTSTQDRARQLIGRDRSCGTLHGTVILADEQTTGRGRLGRRWLAGPGQGLLMTCLLHAGQTSADRLMLAATCAVAESVERTTGLTTQLRWPNDVLLDGAKLAGILLERAGGYDLVGIGINVHGRPALPDQPTASLAQAGRPVDRLLLADRLLEQLDHDLHRADEQHLRQAWRQRSALLQRRVTVRWAGRELTGRVVDVDVSSGLLLSVEHGGPVVLPAATTTLVAVHDAPPDDRPARAKKNPGCP